MKPAAPPHPRAVREDEGFILVGVVMFMLALTILGLSLFALSSYEAQFFYSNVSREQSLHSSESGMEIVQALLTDPSRPARLEYAQLAVGQFGVTRALAYQARSSNPNDTTSRGLVNWDSTVVIVVTSRAGGEERTIESRFLPTTQNSPYKTLFTSGLGLFYNTSNTTSRNVELQGKIWQRVWTSADTAWTRQVNWTTGRPLDPSAPSLPAANAFVDQKLAGSPSTPSWDENNYIMRFNNTSGGVKFYRSPPSPHSAENDPEFNQYTFYNDAATTIRIRGTCVWVVPAGACFRRRVTLTVDQNGVPGTLVIIAKPNGRAPGYENRGLWFQGGLILNDPTNTKLFLVSEGDIGITHDHSSASSNDVKALTVVAGGNLELMGPSSGYTFKLTHDASMDALSDNLVASGALPPTSGGTGTSYIFAGSSWKESRLP